MNSHFAFEEVAHLPSAADNCAVATSRLEADTELSTQSTSLRLDYTVLEGHRFAVRRINLGDALVSWGVPFGYAESDMNPGAYVCNQGTLEELKRREINLPLPTRPNFRDHYEPYLIDTETFTPGTQVSLYQDPGTFQGYLRGGSRGVGTRNYIVILATNSRTGSYARSLARLMREHTDPLGSLDGVVAVAHTEAGGEDRPNNLEHTLRTLAGFIVHPNVGGVLVVDQGPGWIDNNVLRQYMLEHRYPLDDVLHEFLTVAGEFQQSLEKGRKIIAAWLEPVQREPRSLQPLENLKVGLQCGGSDSFSGISSNPLLSQVAKEVIRNGGTASLAETNELVGAESYILSNVRDLNTAYQFLFKIEEFKRMMKWHGHTPEQNPSGGNRFRGLYNIALKSIGAAQKRHSSVRLDYVIEYAEQMTRPGYYFMNSPGNDLESISGQVASGANIIFFSTGSGSITNFPFVPTIKVMSTTQRYRLMPDDMDINAGAHLDGIPLNELADGMFKRMIDVASSAPSKGEKAQHSQVSIWRNWEQTDTKCLSRLEQAREPDGTPIDLLPVSMEPKSGLRELLSAKEDAFGRLGLLLPNSLCSSEIARMLSDRVNRITSELSVSKVVSLTHTEGCGAVSGSSQELLVRTLIGHMTHPLVHSCMLLEHGCENVHHQYIRGELRRRKLATEQFGWASIQLDGGIEQAAKRVENWFKTRPVEPPTGFASRPLTIGILTLGSVPDEVSSMLADLTRSLVHAGCNVVVPQSGCLGSCRAYVEELGLRASTSPSLRYAGRIENPGFHVMETPSNHWIELLTGLGSTGVQILLAYVAEGPCQGHPFVPLVQFSSFQSADVDLVLTNPSSSWLNQLYRTMTQTVSGHYIPQTLSTGNTDSQVPRGPLGFSV